MYTHVYSMLYSTILTNRTIVSAIVSICYPVRYALVCIMTCLGRLPRGHQLHPGPAHQAGLLQDRPGLPCYMI